MLYGHGLVPGMVYSVLLNGLSAYTAEAPEQAAPAAGSVPSVAVALQPVEASSVAASGAAADTNDLVRNSAITGFIFMVIFIINYN